MKTRQIKNRPTQANRYRRPIITAFRQPTITPTSREPAHRPQTAHDFLAVCLYPGMDDHSTAA